jgi:anaerobic selenocysteine-containing dehydrogenase
VEPVGESRRNADVFGELLQRLELDADGDPAASSRKCSTCSSQLPEPAGGRCAIRRRHAALRRPADSVRGRVPAHADQKVDLCPDALDARTPAGLYGYQPDPATAEFPLTLISPASERSITPRSPSCRARGEAADAPRRRGGARPADGDAVRVFNALGEVRCNVQVGAWIRPGSSACRRVCGGSTPPTASRPRAGAGHA